MHTLQDDMQRLLGKNPKVFANTDFKQILDSLSRGRRTTEKRVSINIAAARDSWNRIKIDHIGLICGDDSTVGALENIRVTPHWDVLFTAQTTQRSLGSWSVKRHGMEPAGNVKTAVIRCTGDARIKMLKWIYCNWNLPLLLGMILYLILQPYELETYVCLHCISRAVSDPFLVFVLYKQLTLLLREWSSTCNRHWLHSQSRLRGLLPNKIGGWDKRTR